MSVAVRMEYVLYVVEFKRKILIFSEGKFGIGRVFDCSRDVPEPLTAVGEKTRG